MVARLVLILALLSACTADTQDAGRTDSGSQKDASDGTDASASDAGSEDSGGSGDAAVQPGVPILERTPTGAFTCTVSRSMITADLAGDYGVSPAIAVSGAGEVLSARTTIDPSLRISQLGLDGTLGPDLVVIAAQSDVRLPSIQTESGGFAIAWIESNRIRFARYDQGGAELIAPHDVGPIPAFRIAAMHLARSTDGYGIAWIELAFDKGIQSALRFVALDASGEARGDSTIEAVQPDVQFFGPKVGVTDSGFVIAYQRLAATFGEVFFAGVDQAGALQGTPQRLTRFEGRGAFSFVSPSVTLERIGSAWVVGWVEDSYSEEDIHSVVRLARVDDAGAVLIAPTVVRSAEQDIEEIEPRIIAFNGAIALVWSRGLGSRTCGICTPGHALQLVLLDAETWAPASNVIEMPSTIIGERGQLGGVLGPAPVAVGSDIVTAFFIRYHTQSSPASAVVRCE